MLTCSTSVDAGQQKLPLQMRACAIHLMLGTTVRHCAGSEIIPLCLQHEAIFHVERALHSWKMVEREFRCCLHHLLLEGCLWPLLAFQLT